MFRVFNVGAGVWNQTRVRLPLGTPCQMSIGPGPGPCPQRGWVSRQDSADTRSPATYRRRTRARIKDGSRLSGWVETVRIGLGWRRAGDSQSQGSSPEFGQDTFASLQFSGQTFHLWKSIPGILLFQVFVIILPTAKIYGGSYPEFLIWNVIRVLSENPKSTQLLFL